MRQQIDQKVNEANHKKAKRGLSFYLYELAKQKKKFEERQHKEIKCYLFQGISCIKLFYNLLSYI